MESAFFWWQFANISSLLTPAFFGHFVLAYFKKDKRVFIWGIYSLACCFLAVNFFAREHFLGRLSFMFDQFYYIDWTTLKPPLYLIFYILFYWLLPFYIFYNLLKHFFYSRGLERNQLKYYILGMVVGFVGAQMLWLPAFGVKVYPFSNIFIGISPIIIGYAIVKYRLLDIKIVITRFGIFLIVYSLVLGVPFGSVVWGKKWLMGLLGDSWFWAPMISLLILATAGPFIYLFLQRKAEDRLMQEEKRVQNLLMNASYGMNIIHSSMRLFELVVTVAVKILKVKRAAVYVLGGDAKQYALKHAAGDHVPDFILAENPLVGLLNQKKFPVVGDEIKAQSDIDGSSAIIKTIDQMSAAVVVPFIANGSLIGFLILGDRYANEIYSKEMLNILMILGNQTALALENCYYWETETKRMEEDGVKERMVTLDYMASSMAHEIDNPIHVMRQHIGIFRRNLVRDHRIAMPEELKEKMVVGLDRVDDSCQRISEMIDAVLMFSRLGKPEDIKPMDIEVAMKEFLVLLDFQFRHERIVFEKDIEGNLPLICWNKIHLDEIVMNLANNAIHAVKRLKDKKIILKIFKKSEDIVRIEFSDNGYGIPKEKLNDIFAAHTTTKGSAEGTGLGLFRVRKIMDFYRGKVWAESEGEDKGSTFCVEIPTHKEENGNLMNYE